MAPATDEIRVQKKKRRFRRDSPLRNCVGIVEKKKKIFGIIALILGQVHNCLVRLSAVRQTNKQGLE